MKKWLKAKWKFYKRLKEYKWPKRKWIKIEYMPYAPQKNRDDWGNAETLTIWLFNNFVITIKPKRLDNPPR